MTLPMPLTRFVGREAELTEAKALLADTRLLTLTGPGGAGKTRLALQLAMQVASEFSDGVWFVDLAPLSGVEFLWDQVAAALGVREAREGSLAEAVGRRLADRRALLVLDNCEHVVEGAAEVTARLLPAAAALKVLATSREPIGVAGEVTWAVPSMREADAVELFTDRASQAWPQFELRSGDTDAVLDICRRLDGLPLAIELAAARTRALDPSQIASGLKDRLALLAKGPRTAPRRQSTLAASFEWSFELLSRPEQSLLGQLSVFAGGFDAEAALAVCPAASLELLAALADRSLIVVERTGDRTASRFRMLETVREFAAEHLDERQEVEAIRSRHRDHYLALAEAMEPVMTSPDDARAQAILVLERDNLRSAMVSARDSGEYEYLARMLSSYGWYWVLTNRLVEMRRWLDTLDRAENLPPHLLARMKFWACFLALFTGERLAEVPAMANEALDLARSAGAKKDEALGLVINGVLAGLTGGTDAMRPYVEETVRVARAAGFAYGTVMALEFFVILRMFQSEPEEIARLSDEAIVVAEAGVARHTQLTNRSFRGIFALTQGDLADAHARLAAVVEDGRHMTDFNYLHSLCDVGLVEMFQGEFFEARRRVAEAVAAAERSEAEGRSAAGVGLHSRFVLGWIELAAGNSAEAKESMKAIAEAASSSLLRPLAALPLVLLAEAQLMLGELDGAGATLEEAVASAGPRNLTWLLGRATFGLAKLRLRQGNVQDAESLAHEALNLGREAGDQMGLVDELELLATLAAEQANRREAVRLWAASDSNRHRIGNARFPIDQASYEAALAQVRQALGADSFAAAWSEGANLSLAEAIAYAARGRGERKRPTAGWASLTPSELEVVRLVGEHLSNPEIAKRLFVSRATVKTHLVHIFAKLGIDSRSALAAEAIKRGGSRRQVMP